MALSLELRDTFYLQVFSKRIYCLLQSFCTSFHCNSMPCSGCSNLAWSESQLKKMKIVIFINESYVNKNQDQRLFSTYFNLNRSRQRKLVSLWEVVHFHLVKVQFLLELRLVFLME